MIPSTGARARAPFPYVGIATAVLLLHAILVAVLPANPYRAAFALLALFAVGYCTLALIVGDSIRLSASEILAFSTGLTIFVSSLSALGVSLLGIPITVFAVVIVGLPIAILAWFLRRSGAGGLTAVTTFTRGVFDFSEYSRSEKAIATALLAGITAALVVLISLSVVRYPNRLSTGLAITGDGDVLPTQFFVGQPQNISVSAFAGSTAGAFTLRIRLYPQNATGNGTYHTVVLTSPLRLDAFAEHNESFVLDSGQSWTRRFSISIELTGDLYLRFDLFESIGSSPAMVATNTLPVHVRP
ncbi:MAG TPA: hypothetical protein VEO18_01215 [Thermoplasmata archaeon]|nr:hypothetical protein [Thermoplasmata archaeon]